MVKYLAAEIQPKEMSLGRIKDTMYRMRYKVYDKEMEHVFDEKDLGVTIDSQLTFV